MKYLRSYKTIIILITFFCLTVTLVTLFMTGEDMSKIPVIGSSLQKLCGAVWDDKDYGKDEIEGVPTIVIDPGHGGIDGGASGKSGILEREINLSIGNLLKEELSQYPVNVIMTRTDDKGLYIDDARPIRVKKREDLLKRKEIMEGDDVLVSISIHLNSFAGNEKICGAQVFYPKSSKNGTNVHNEKSFSQKVAESVQESLNNNVSGMKKRKAASKGDILIFQDTTANIILVECGFLSNWEEEKKLKSVDYQRLLSKAIWQGVNEILCLKKGEAVKIIDSANKKDFSQKQDKKICG